MASRLLHHDHVLRRSAAPDRPPHLGGAIRLDDHEQSGPMPHRLTRRAEQQPRQVTLGEPLRTRAGPGGEEHRRAAIGPITGVQGDGHVAPEP